MRKGVLVIGAAIAAAWGTPAMSGGAYCEPEWRPENPDLGCASQIPIAPGNDSRVNLFLLMQDRAGNSGAGLEYPDLEWRSFYGRNFLRWQNLHNAWYPIEETEYSANDDWVYPGDGRCQTSITGQAAFNMALDANGRIEGEAGSLLRSLRERITAVCKDKGTGGFGPVGDGGFFTNIGANGVPDAGTAFMGYLEGSASFYNGDWDRAVEYYAKVRNADRDPWVSETALYMIARTRLNEAIESADDKWGWFDLEKADAAIAKRAEDGFRAYLAAYPQGRYAASAKGLIRKALWLQEDYGRLGAIYGDMLEAVDPEEEQLAALIDEVDDKLLIRESAGQLDHVYLLAVDDLMRMRNDYYADGDEKLTKAELDGQAAVFANHPELYGFLKANFAFYVEQDFRAARDLLPDDARQDSYSPLAFSRQYLRGLTLHALRDRNEEGFWLELIEGANGIWQRPAIELALARLWEGQGRLDKVFAEGSPIDDSRIRNILLGSSAGPDLLKAQARATDRPVSERSLALFTVLLKQLQRGEYRGFLADYPLAKDFPARDEDQGMWNVIDAEIAPVDIFAAGKWSSGYPCGSIDATVQRLARNPKDIDGRLCLGDFYRLNGLDDFQIIYRYRTEGQPPELGDSDAYGGTVLPRHDFYTSIMSDRSASRDQRAYALYRAVRCYAPANMNSCGGEGVEEPQRAAWFRQLKRDYGDTRWAKDLEYYW